MFRNPRENATRGSSDSVKPSTGRAPSPLRASTDNANALSSPPARTAAKTPSKPATLAQLAKPTPSSTPRSAKAKNSSILSFFKKADKPPEALFVGNGSPVKNGARNAVDFNASPSPRPQDLEDDTDRYQELASSVKRRKVSHDGASFDNAGCSPPPDDIAHDETTFVQHQPNTTTIDSQPQARSGPFVDDSDSEDEEAQKPPDAFAEAHDGHDILEFDDLKEQSQSPKKDSPSSETETKVPSLRRASTSVPDFGADDFADFEGMGDFEDEYEEGEEFLNRCMIQEQGFEGAFESEANDEDPSLVEIDGTEPETPETNSNAESGLEKATSDSVAACPICRVSFEGVTDQEASVHVNHCLDGNPTPLPRSKQHQPEPPLTKSSSSAGVNAESFKRPPRPAKPGQTNPPSLKTSKNSANSAFSKLMSGHSEETAFAEAAASEKKSFGMPSYRRTCPFYKILPGMSICVDAFRYGAVEGCNAYFLSHFHSDHYVGLTSSWTHGPIYCSGVTGRLVKQQLRVEAKYVKELDWEETVEVPNTPGVRVTMIPANHCPGSSIFLFEKNLPGHSNAKPRQQRVLHCGDFRACPAHVEHPLLKPDVFDKVAGRTREQTIDVCYLDTTYLNPKWAFPSQEDVIRACAEMCLTLNTDAVDEKDKFAEMLREKTDGAMTKFIQTSTTHSTSATATATTTANAEEAVPTAVAPAPSGNGPLLVVVGTYSIGKERICLGIARALDSKIYAPPPKTRIIAALRDPDLSARMTSDPRLAQVHMTPLFEIRPDTLADYVASFGGRFARAVAFRPSGWNFRSPGARGQEPGVPAVLHSGAWKSVFGARDLAPQRGSSAAAAVFGVPYSEHSSFRELSMFCCALRIGRVIPTVNVGTRVGRARMNAWIERWAAERRKNGLFRVVDADGKSTWYPGEGTWGLRTTL